MTTDITPEAAERARIRLIADVLAIDMFKRHPIYSHEIPPTNFSEEFHRNFGTWDTAQEVAVALAAQEDGGERVTDVRRFEDLVFIGLDAYRNWRSELEADGSDVTIADRNIAGLIVALRAALRAAQEGTGNGSE